MGQRIHLFVVREEQQHGEYRLRQHGQESLVKAVDIVDFEVLGEAAAVQELRERTNNIHAFANII